MITLKVQLLNEIKNMPDNTFLKTIEVLSTGEKNTMTFFTSKENLYNLINENFNDNLIGKVPNGLDTSIKGWEVVDGKNID